MTYFIGQRLRNKKYLLKREIGRGSFGIIYQAIDRTLERAVAIKTLALPLRQHLNFQDYVHQFHAEALVLAKFSHPNIVGIKEFFIENRLPYIVMDYISGLTLDRIVLPDRPLPETTAIAYVRQIGAALQVVHDRGLVHRDIKPKNAIFDRDRKQIISLDFGSAREFKSDKSRWGTNLVSDGYAPIEQYLLEAELTPATDIYGLAATLYTLLTGKVPPSAVSRYHHPLDSPQQIRPELSDLVNEAVMYGMALESQDRPASVAEWLALLPFNSKNSSALALRSKSATALMTRAPRQISALENESFEKATSAKFKRKTFGLAGKMMLGIGAFVSAWLPLPIARQDTSKPPDSNTKTQSAPAIDKKSTQPSIIPNRLSPTQKRSNVLVTPVSAKSVSLRKEAIVPLKKQIRRQAISTQIPRIQRSSPKRNRKTRLSIAKSFPQPQIFRQSSPQKIKPLFRKSLQTQKRIEHIAKKRDKFMRKTQRKLAKFNRKYK
jgi:serine/threonine-protein kinase